MPAAADLHSDSSVCEISALVEGRRIVLIINSNPLSTVCLIAQVPPGGALMSCPTVLHEAFPCP